MSAFGHRVGLAAMAGLIGLAGCGTAPVGRPGGAQSPGPASSAPGTTVSAVSLPAVELAVPPAGTRPACSRQLSYLTAIRVGRHGGFDRVVFQFAGKVPVTTVERVDAIYNDPRGYRIPVAGQSYLRLTFDRASAVCQPPHRTYPGPAVLTPYYPRLLMTSPAGDFAGVLAFGLGLAAKGGYHVFALTSPSRLVIDVSHVPLGKFPGIWRITSWRGYWAAQYAWLSGHQRWLSDPVRVVRAWALSRYGVAPVLHKLNAVTVRFALHDGTIVTVTGTRPVSTPGPWVITRICYTA